MATREGPGLSLRAIRKAENTDLPLLALRAIREIRSEIDALEVIQIQSARDKGASWDDIAEALGITRQALQQRMRARRTSMESSEEIRLSDDNGASV